MADKDLRKLNRAELLELLIAQTKENELLQGQIVELNGKLDAMQTQLEQRQILIQNAGSIAEASLLLNGVFDAAQLAAQEYLENIRVLSQQQETYARQTEEQAQEKAQKMLQETEQRCQQLESATKQRCDEMTEKAHKESQAYWNLVSRKLNEYIKQRSDLRELLSEKNKKV